MGDTPIGRLLKAWSEQRIHFQPKVMQHIPIERDDIAKLEALAEVYQLPKEEIIASLLSNALHEVEQRMPYIAGPTIIRIEEGDPVYEDIGPTPKYLKIKSQIEKNQKKATN